MTRTYTAANQEAGSAAFRVGDRVMASEEAFRQHIYLRHQHPVYGRVTRVPKNSELIYVARSDRAKTGCGFHASFWTAAGPETPSPQRRRGGVRRFDRDAIIAGLTQGRAWAQIAAEVGCSVALVNHVRWLLNRKTPIRKAPSESDGGATHV